MQNINPDPLSTPVYLKTNDEWPPDKMFYLMSRNGLFLCRNHEWFRSCAPAAKGPGSLEEQQSFCKLSYPKIPRLLLEQAVGFFHHIYQKEEWESALILVWNRQTNQMELVCPEQKASWATVKYDIPTLPPHLALIGDLHSHGSMSPNPSMKDEGDELKRPGLHIVVGNINDEPPEFYCAAVADGTRFKVEDPYDVSEGYNQRIKEFPQEWLEKISEHKYKHVSSCSDYGDHWGGSGGLTGLNYSEDMKAIKKNDRDILGRVKARFLKLIGRPKYEEVRQAMFTETKHVTYLECERQASKFLKNWDKIKEKNEKLIINE